MMSDTRPTGWEFWLLLILALVCLALWAYAGQQGQHAGEWWQ